MKKIVLLLVLLFFSLVTGIRNAAALGSGRADGSAGAHFSGEAPNDVAGTSMARAGDVNGDGYGDFLIGAPSNDSGPGNDGGAAYLILGGPGGWSLGKRLGQAPTIEYTGEADADNAGVSVAGAGDVNGDGFDDFLIGANLNDDGGASAGAVYLVLGSATPTGVSLSTVVQYTGEAAGNQAGLSVAGGGDVNGDGFDDILIGAPLNNDGGASAGAAYLILGSATPASASLSTAVQYTGEAAGNQAGRGVAIIGDSDRDGRADMLIGAPINGDGGANAGSIYLVVGSAAPASTGLGAAAPTVVQFSGSGGENAGQSVAAVGDVNGDGFADLWAGAPLNDTAAADAGAAYLVLGRPGMPANTLATVGIRYTGEAANDQAGASVGGGGDVNGDGFADMLVGAPFSTTVDNGAAYIVLGSAGPATASLSTAIRYLGPLNNDTANAVAGAGDVNGDGLADVLMGATGNDIIFSNAGGVYLIWGDPLTTHVPAFRQRQNLNGTGDALPVLFDQAGVRVDFTAGALIDGDINVTRHLFHPCATDIRLTMPIWTVESAKLTTGATVNLRFKYNEGHIAGMTEGSLQLWTRPAGRPCADWVPVGGTVDTVHNFITVTGVTSFGQFTIADGAPSPTAIQEATMQAVVAEQPGWLVVVMLAVLGLAAATRQAIETIRKEQ